MCNVSFLREKGWLIAFFGAVATPMAAQEFTFSIHHFLSPKSATQTVLLEPWAASIEEASGGRIAFEIFPSMALGGAPPELYGQVRDGVADIVWTLPGYTPGVFPRLEVFELPNVHRGDALATNMAIQDLMVEISPDLDDVHPLLIHTHAGNALHLGSATVNTLADLAGLKIRSPSRTGAWMLEALGAEPVGMPVPALPQALARGNVDAALVPFEVAIPLQLAELTDSSVELNLGARFGTSTFMLAMNSDAYDSLPDDLKQIIDDHSGPDLATDMGLAWNEIELQGIQIARDAGNTVTRLSVDASAEFDAPFAAVAQRWSEEVAGAGVDAGALLEAARSAIAKHADATAPQ